MRTITNDRGHEITMGLLCPCCGQHTRRQWVQPALMPGRQSHEQTDCINSDCPAFYATLSLSQFEQRFGVKLGG